MTTMEDVTTSAPGPDARVSAETAKLIAESIKLNAETGKLQAETAKLNRDARFYPIWVVGGIAVGLASAAAILFHH